MNEYKIDAKATIPYSMYIKANSQEEARKIAEEKASSYQKTYDVYKTYMSNKDTAPDIQGYIFKTFNITSNTAYDRWQMTIDDFELTIESVYTKPRPFIPNYDD